MPKRRRLTDDEIPKLPRKTKRYTLADPEPIGHYLRVPARKSKAPITFVAVARQGGKQLWTTLGTANTLGLAQARELARDVIGRVRLLGPSTRVWTAKEVNEWLASRPTEQSRQTRERVARSVEARRQQTAPEIDQQQKDGRAARILAARRIAFVS
jgi:hypothetical protein